MANLKSITELPVAESAEGLNLIVNDNGVAKQIVASAVGAQADWAEMDENSPAFIKNKPASGYLMKLDFNELTVVDDAQYPSFICTANFDQLAKTLDSGCSASIAMPAGFFGDGSPVVVFTPLEWFYMNNSLIVSTLVITMNMPATITFINGTYIPFLD